jgi:hypothetical protein
MVGTTSDWEDELGRWLEPFLERLGHGCPLYVAGLIGPGDRKSVQRDYDQLHHFVAAGVWKEAPLEIELLIQADKLVGDQLTKIGRVAREARCPPSSCLQERVF